VRKKEFKQKINKCTNANIIFYTKFVITPIRFYLNNIDNQLHATITVYYWFQSAQHVSGDDFTHLQMHLTVFTACCIIPYPTAFP